MARSRQGHMTLWPKVACRKSWSPDVWSDDILVKRHAAVATLKQKSVTSWLNEIKEETTSAIVSQYSSLTPQKWMIHNDRKIHSALIKLRTKHNGLKHNTSRHFHTIDEEDNEADPWCRFGCPKREDEDHLLLDCPQFESHRNKLKSHLADLKVSFSSKNTTWPRKKHT